jgi:hypothetical protein
MAIATSTSTRAGLSTVFVRDAPGASRIAVRVLGVPELPHRGSGRMTPKTERLTVLTTWRLSVCPAALRVGCAKPGSCSEAVFVDEAAEAVSALDGGRWCMHDSQLEGRWIGRFEVE